MHQESTSSTSTDNVRRKKSLEISTLLCCIYIYLGWMEEEEKKRESQCFCICTGEEEEEEGTPLNTGAICAELTSCCVWPMNKY